MLTVSMGIGSKEKMNKTKFQIHNMNCVESGKTKQGTLVSQSVNYQFPIGTITSSLKKGLNHG